MKHSTKENSLSASHDGGDLTAEEFGKRLGEKIARPFLIELERLSEENRKLAASNLELLTALKKIADKSISPLNKWDATGFQTIAQNAINSSKGATI